MLLEKFRLLCWKNFTLQKRHPIAGLFEILFPVIIVLIFVFARNNLKPEITKELKFDGFKPEIYQNCRTHSGDPFVTIAVSPGDNKAIVDLVQSSVGVHSQIEIKFFDSAQALNDFLNFDNNTIAGIEFDDHLKVSLFGCKLRNCDDMTLSHLAELGDVAKDT